LFAAWIPWVGQGSEEFAKGQWGIDDKASGARKHRKASEPKLANLPRSSQ